MNANMVAAVLFVLLCGCAVTALAMCVVAKACDSWYGDLDADGEPGPHEKLAADNHEKMVALMVKSMTAEREKAFAEYLQTPCNVVPIVRQGEA